MSDGPYTSDYGTVIGPEGSISTTNPSFWAEKLNAAYAAGVAQARRDREALEQQVRAATSGYEQDEDAAALYERVKRVDALARRALEEKP